MRTFLDSGVLIAAARGTGPLGIRALALFNETQRVFLSSEFVQMEVLPKAIYYRHAGEQAFYEDFFADAQLIPLSAGLSQLAYTEACQAGLSGLDALHVAAAKMGEAEEFITTEKPTQTLFRVTGLRITSIALSS